ncbi:hypothetical protein D3Z45_20235 [Lachnospiraceae bacterium]|nr:hypothetical protein [Lachnospiraceae bacterium]
MERSIGVISVIFPSFLRRFRCFKFADAARTQTIRFLNLNVFGKMFSIEAFAQLKCPDIGMNWFIGLESFVSIIFIGDWEDFFSSEKAFRGDGGKRIK